MSFSFIDQYSSQSLFDSEDREQEQRHRCEEKRKQIFPLHRTVKSRTNSLFCRTKSFENNDQ